MNILVIGSGGRESAIVFKLSLSKKIKKIYAAPGNAGIMKFADCVDIEASNIEKLADFALKSSIDYTIVGPEMPLISGITDYFENLGLKIFGPNKNAAIIEGSKNFMKHLLKKYNIPTAKFKSFYSQKDALDYIKKADFPLVVKADGLASGKGVVVAKERGEAEEAIFKMMVEKIFRSSGDTVLIEEYLEGPEASILAFTDSKTIVPMVSAMDYKRVFDKNMGPNTGGMGSIAPNPYVDSEMMNIINRKILQPTIKAMEMEGRKYKGVLYAGLILTKDGPKVLEFNARFGDPETQVILPLLDCDLMEVTEAVISENLDALQIKWKDEKAICVVLASSGYPSKYETGYEIKGLDNLKDVLVFHAGTKLEGEKIITTGGRVLGITAAGKSYKEAREKVYKNISYVNFKNTHYRKDIGLF